MKRPVYLFLGLVLSVLLTGCPGGGGGESVPANPYPNVGAGWATIDSARSDSQDAYLSGNAFISPTGWSCCSGPAVHDTGVIVSWTNMTTGTSEQASQHLTYFCLFSSCSPFIHEWNAVVPLAQEENQILITASDSSGNIGHAYITIAPNTPAVSNTFPANQATGVGVNESLTATFSEVMDPATLNATTFTLKAHGYDPVSGTVSYSGTTATFTPSAALAASTYYSATITRGVKSLAGIPMAIDYSWSFTTGIAPDITPPIVFSVAPSNGATGVAVTSTMNVNFSEPMDATTINTSTFSLKDGAGNSVNGTVDYSGRSARFTPAAALTLSSTYTATIAAGAKDTAGNALASDYIWSFTTGSSLQSALDATFGTGGIVTSTGGSYANAIAKDSTFMYVAGNGVGFGWRIEKRTLSDGVLAPGFGTNGAVTSGAAGGTVTSLAIDSSFMYVVGYEYNFGLGIPAHWRIEKRNLSDGALVAGFGTNGVVTSAQTTIQTVEKASGVAIDSTFMYVVGDDYESFGHRVGRIEKRNLSDGSLVPTFGTNGVITVNLSGNYGSAEAIAIDSSSMYVAGFVSNYYFDEGRIEKRNLSDGALATGFGTNGVVIALPTGYATSAAHALSIDSNFIYAVTYHNIEKRNLSDGALAAGFGTNGVVTTNSFINGITVDSTFMYATGSSHFGREWGTEKRNLSDGALIAGFGTGGVVTSNAGGEAKAIAIDATFIYVAGYDTSASIYGNWKIEKRYK